MPKINVQWSKLDPDDRKEMDSDDWGDTPSKPVPTGDEELDNDEGWPCVVDCQGIKSAGDHIAVENLEDDGVKIITWNDDDDDYPEGDKYAIEWTMLPLAPNPDKGDAIDTRQSRVIYAQTNVYDYYDAMMPIENTTLKTWADFILPDAEITRHGIWMSDELFNDHKDKQSHKGWRNYGHHLDPKELKDGKVKDQRNQGRYKKAEGTLTYYMRNQAEPTGIHGAVSETALNTNSGPTAPLASNVPTVGDTLTHAFTTTPGEPGSADWPNGAYRAQLDVSSAGGSLTYGLKTIGGSAGHFATVDNGLTGDQETWTQDEATFSGTGLKLATNTIDPASVDNTDRFEILIAAANSDSMMEQPLTLDGDNTDSFADGPWPGVGWSGQVNGVTDPEKVISVEKANIAKVNGVQ